MLQSYSIIIEEIDDIEEALSEAKEQLSQITLRKNSVGIVTTHPEYLITGVFEAVCEAMPFPTVGITTVTQSVEGRTETYLFSLLVLTSDDCSFSCGYSDPIPKEGDVSALTQKAYRDLRSRLEGDNKLTLLYVPMITSHYSYQYISALSELDEAVPVFGMVANDDKDGSIYDNNSKTLINGSDFDDRLVLVLASGNISPKFYIGSLTEESVLMSRIGEVTSAVDNKLLGINNMNSLDFFKKVGSRLGENEHLGILATTFLFDSLKEDGAPVCRSPLLVDEEGVVCGGNVPIGSVLSMASSTYDVVIETARNVVEEIKANHKDGTILMYSCVGRRYSLLANPFLEFAVFQESLKDDYRYVAAYASGEICPTSTNESKAKNEEHNQTLVVCVLN